MTMLSIKEIFVFISLSSTIEKYVRFLLYPTDLHPFTMRQSIQVSSNIQIPKNTV